MPARSKTLPRTHYNVKPHAIGMLVLLSLQYLFGEFTNLFVSFPTHKLDKQLWYFAWSQIPVVIHIIFGFLLLLGTLALFFRALNHKDKIWTLSSGIASIVVIEAVFAGVIFIPTQKDVYSLIMAVNFLIALYAYFWGLYKTK